MLQEAGFVDLHMEKYYEKKKEKMVMTNYFCMNCGVTTTYIETPYPDAKSWEVEKQYENVRCSKCNGLEIYRYRTLWEWLSFKWTSWWQGWELYCTQDTYSKRKLEKRRKEYLANEYKGDN